MLTSSKINSSNLEAKIIHYNWRLTQKPLKMQVFIERSLAEPEKNKQTTKDILIPFSNYIFANQDFQHSQLPKQTNKPIKIM